MRKLVELMDNLDCDGRIFKKFRTIGIVCDNGGFALDTLGTESFLTASIGKAFHTYDCRKLNLICVSDICEEKITKLITTNTQLIACAHGKSVSLYKRGKIIDKPFIHQYNVSNIFCFGENILSIDEQGFLNMWDYTTKKIIYETRFNPETYRLTAWCHPPTYVNKMLFGFSNGFTQLWNLRTAKMIHEFKSFESEISVLKETPVLDVIAVGLVNGQVKIYNIRYNEIISTINSDIGPISAISFRTDHVINSVALSSSDGHLMIWDLEHKRIISSLTFAHRGAIFGMEFLLNQPLLMTAGTDNTIKVWIFDVQDGSCRELKKRGGHKNYIKKIKFIVNSGHFLLSSSFGDEFRFTNCNRDEQSIELSHGKPTKVNGKMIPKPRCSEIIDFYADKNKEYFWDNGVSCHVEDRYIHTWKIYDKIMGKHLLGKNVIHLKHQFPLSLTLTVCGNYCIGGYSKGSIELYNIQSGQHRGSFIDEDSPCIEPVIGLASDGNNCLCCSISNDSYLRIWYFQTHKLRSRIKLAIQPHKIELQKESLLAAISTIGAAIYIIDIQNDTTIRCFNVHERAIVLDFCFSNDSRWLIASSNDSFIMIWDLPSAKLIDKFHTNKPVISLSLSSKEDLLAIVYEQETGIHLLINKMMFSDIVLTPIDLNEPNKILEYKISYPIEPFSIQTADGITEKLATLSLYPSSRWRHLDKIDIIKERSKPKEPIKKLESAPFFLPTVPGLTTSFDVLSTVSDIKKDSKIRKHTEISQTILIETLLKCDKEQTIDPLSDLLLLFNPSEMDRQLRSLNSQQENDISNLKLFIKLFSAILSECENFEYFQGTLALFLHIHGTVLLNEELKELLKNLQTIIDKKWKNLSKLLNESISIVGFIRSSVIHF